MAQAHIEPKYRCGDCREIHDDEEDALECCQPDVEEVFICPMCSDVHKTEEYAIDCCGFDPDKQPEYRPTAQELEAAGQIRLF